MYDSELRARIASDLGIVDYSQRTTPELLVQHQRWVLNKQGLGLLPGSPLDVRIGTIETAISLLAPKDSPTFTTSVALPGGGPTLRAPVNGSVVINGNTAKNLPGDKVAYGLSSTITGGFTGDTGNNPGFAWGCNIFTTTGKNVGDIAGVNNFTAAEIEMHLYTPSSVVNSLKGGQFDCRIEATATGATITSMFGVYVSALGNSGATGITVTNTYGIYVEAPTIGTNQYAIFANGTVNIIGSLVASGTAHSLTGPILFGGGAVRFSGDTTGNVQGSPIGTHIGTIAGGPVVAFADGTNTFAIDVSSNNLRIMRASVNELAHFDASGNFFLTGSFTFADNKNLIFNATNGTRIGTAATQKIGFWNATPIVQPTGMPIAAIDATTTQALVNNIRAKLISLGLST